MRRVLAKLWLTLVGLALIGSVAYAAFCPYAQIGLLGVAVVALTGTALVELERR